MNTEKAFEIFKHDNLKSAQEEWETLTWEQRASNFANVNGRLIKANEELVDQNERLRRLLNNSETMNKFYREKIEKLEKLVYSS